MRTLPTLNKIELSPGSDDKYHLRGLFSPRKRSMWIPLSKPSLDWMWTNPVSTSSCCVHCSLTQPPTRRRR